MASCAGIVAGSATRSLPRPAGDGVVGQLFRTAPQHSASRHTHRVVPGVGWFHRSTIRHDSSMRAATSRKRELPRPVAHHAAADINAWERTWMMTFAGHRKPLVAGVIGSSGQLTGSLGDGVGGVAREVAGAIPRAGSRRNMPPRGSPHTAHRAPGRGGFLRLDPHRGHVRVVRTTARPLKVAGVGGGMQHATNTGSSHVLVNEIPSSRTAYVCPPPP